MGVGGEPGSWRLRGGAAVGEQAHQRSPVGERVVFGDGAQVLEQAHSRAEPLAGLLPECFGEFAGGVQREGEQVEDDEHVGEGVGAVAEVVLEVVTVLLEDIEGFVLDLPSGAGALGEFGDVGAVDGQAGDEGAAVGDGAVGSRAGDLEPVDAQGVVAIAQRQVGHPAVVVDASPRPGAGADAAGGRTDAVEVLVEGLMAGRLGGEQEVAAAVEHGPAHGLAGVEVVAEVDRAQCGVARAVALQPALGGLALAVLLGEAVAALDELRRQRQRAGVARRHHGGGEHLVEVLGGAVAALAGRAVRAMDGAPASTIVSDFGRLSRAVALPTGVLSLNRSTRTWTANMLRTFWYDTSWMTTVAGRCCP